MIKVVCGVFLAAMVVALGYQARRYITIIFNVNYAVLLNR